jgi:hypothetical protein
MLHVNFQSLEVLTLIREKNKKISITAIIFFLEKTPLYMFRLQLRVIVIQKLISTPTMTPTRTFLICNLSSILFRLLKRIYYLGIYIR